MLWNLNAIQYSSEKGGDAKVAGCTNLLTGIVEKTELTMEVDGEAGESAGLADAATLKFNKAVELVDK